MAFVSNSPDPVQTPSPEGQAPWARTGPDIRDYAGTFKPVDPSDSVTLLDGRKMLRADLRNKAGGEQLLDLMDRNEAGTRGFVEAYTDIKRVKGDLPFVGDLFGVVMPVKDILRVRDIAKRLEADETVSDEDMVLVQTFVEDQKRMSQTSTMGMVGDIARAMPLFAAEIYLYGKLGAMGGGAAGSAAGGVGAAPGAVAGAIAGASAGAVRGTIKGARYVAKKMLSEGIQNRIGKLLATTAGKQVAARAVKFGTGAVKGALTGAAIAGADTAVNALANTAMGQDAAMSRGAAERYAASALAGEDMSLGMAKTMAAGDRLVEYISEMSGEAFSAFIPSNQVVAKAFDRVFGPTKARAAGALARGTADVAAGKLTWVGRQKIAALGALAFTAKKMAADGDIGAMLARLSKFGYDGYVEEILEERYGDFIRGFTGISGEGAGFRNALSEMIPDKKQLAAEMIGFAIPLGATVAIKRGHMAAHGITTSTMEDDIRTVVLGAQQVAPSGNVVELDAATGELKNPRGVKMPSVEDSYGGISRLAKITREKKTTPLGRVADFFLEAGSLLITGHMSGLSQLSGADILLSSYSRPELIGTHNWVFNEARARLQEGNPTMSQEQLDAGAEAAARAVTTETLSRLRKTIVVQKSILERMGITAEEEARMTPTELVEKINEKVRSGELRRVSYDNDNYGFWVFAGKDAEADTDPLANAVASLNATINEVLVRHGYNRHITKVRTAEEGALAMTVYGKPSMPVSMSELEEMGVNPMTVNGTALAGLAGMKSPHRPTGAAVIRALARRIKEHKDAGDFGTVYQQIGIDGSPSRRVKVTKLPNGRIYLSAATTYTGKGSAHDASIVRGSQDLAEELMQQMSTIDPAHQAGWLEAKLREQNLQAAEVEDIVFHNREIIEADDPRILAQMAYGLMTEEELAATGDKGTKAKARAEKLLIERYGASVKTDAGTYVMDFGNLNSESDITISASLDSYHMLEELLERIMKIDNRMERGSAARYHQAVGDFVRSVDALMKADRDIAPATRTALQGLTKSPSDFAVKTFAALFLGAGRNSVSLGMYAIPYMNELRGLREQLQELPGYREWVEYMAEVTGVTKEGKLQPVVLSRFMDATATDGQKKEMQSQLQTALQPGEKAVGKQAEAAEGAPKPPAKEKAPAVDPFVAASQAAKKRRLEELQAEAAEGAPKPPAKEKAPEKEKAPAVDPMVAASQAAKKRRLAELQAEAAEAKKTPEAGAKETPEEGSVENPVPAHVALKQLADANQNPRAQVTGLGKKRTPTFKVDNPPSPASRLPSQETAGEPKAPELMTPEEWDARPKTTNEDWALKPGRRTALQDAYQEKKPVNARLAESVAAGEKDMRPLAVPEGYIREGDRYVYRPVPPPPPAGDKGSATPSVMPAITPEEMVYELWDKIESATPPDGDVYSEFVKQLQTMIDSRSVAERPLFAKAGELLLAVKEADVDIPEFLDAQLELEAALARNADAPRVLTELLYEMSGVRKQEQDTTTSEEDEAEDDAASDIEARVFGQATSAETVLRALRGSAQMVRALETLNIVPNATQALYDLTHDPVAWERLQDALVSTENFVKWVNTKAENESRVESGLKFLARKLEQTAATFDVNLGPMDYYTTVLRSYSDKQRMGASIARLGSDGSVVLEPANRGDQAATALENASSRIDSIVATDAALPMLVDMYNRAIATTDKDGNLIWDGDWMSDRHTKPTPSDTASRHKTRHAELVQALSTPNDFRARMFQFLSEWTGSPVSVFASAAATTAGREALARMIEQDVDVAFSKHDNPLSRHNDRSVVRYKNAENQWAPLAEAPAEHREKVLRKAMQETWTGVLSSNTKNVGHITEVLRAAGADSALLTPTARGPTGANYAAWQSVDRFIRGAIRFFEKYAPGTTIEDGGLITVPEVVATDAKGREHAYQVSELTDSEWGYLVRKMHKLGYFYTGVYGDKNNHRFVKRPPVPSVEKLVEDYKAMYNAPGMLWIDQLCLVPVATVESWAKALKPLIGSKVPAEIARREALQTALFRALYVPLFDHEVDGNMRYYIPKDIPDELLSSVETAGPLPEARRAEWTSYAMATRANWTKRRSNSLTGNETLEGVERFLGGPVKMLVIDSPAVDKSADGQMLFADSLGKASVSALGARFVGYDESATTLKIQFSPDVDDRGQPGLGKFNGVNIEAMTASHPYWAQLKKLMDATGAHVVYFTGSRKVPSAGAFAKGLTQGATFVPVEGALDSAENIAAATAATAEIKGSDLIAPLSLSAPTTARRARFAKQVTQILASAPSAQGALDLISKAIEANAAAIDATDIDTIRNEVIARLSRRAGPEAEELVAGLKNGTVDIMSPRARRQFNVVGATARRMQFTVDRIRAQVIGTPDGANSLRLSPIDGRVASANANLDGKEIVYAERVKAADAADAKAQFAAMWNGWLREGLSERDYADLVANPHVPGVEGRRIKLPPVGPFAVALADRPAGPREIGFQYRGNESWIPAGFPVIELDDNGMPTNLLDDAIQPAVEEGQFMLFSTRLLADRIPAEGFQSMAFEWLRDRLERDGNLIERSQETHSRTGGDCDGDTANIYLISAVDKEHHNILATRVLSIFSELYRTDAQLRKWAEQTIEPAVDGYKELGADLKAKASTNPSIAQYNGPLALRFDFRVGRAGKDLLAVAAKSSSTLRRALGAGVYLDAPIVLNIDGNPFTISRTQEEAETMLTPGDPAWDRMNLAMFNGPIRFISWTVDDMQDPTIAFAFKDKMVLAMAVVALAFDQATTGKTGEFKFDEEFADAELRFKTLVTWLANHPFLNAVTEAVSGPQINRLRGDKPPSIAKAIKEELGNKNKNYLSKAEWNAWHAAKGEGIKFREFVANNTEVGALIRLHAVANSIRDLGVIADAAVGTPRVQTAGDIRRLTTTRLGGLDGLRFTHPERFNPASTVTAKLMEIAPLGFLGMSPAGNILADAVAKSTEAFNPVFADDRQETMLTSIHASFALKSLVDESGLELDARFPATRLRELKAAHKAATGNDSAFWNLVAPSGQLLGALELLPVYSGPVAVALNADTLAKARREFDELPRKLQLEIAVAANAAFSPGSGARAHAINMLLGDPAASQFRRDLTRHEMRVHGPVFDELATAQLTGLMMQLPGGVAVQRNELSRVLFGTQFEPMKRGARSDEEFEGTYVDERGYDPDEFAEGGDKPLAQTLNLGGKTVRTLADAIVEKIRPDRETALQRRADSGDPVAKMQLREQKRQQMLAAKATPAKAPATKAPAIKDLSQLELGLGEALEPLVDQAKPPAAFRAKERSKALAATRVLAPVEGSTSSYAVRLGKLAQAQGALVDATTRDTTVYVSVPGRGRPGASEATDAIIAQLPSLLERGNTLVTDNEANATRTHNAPGEGRIRQALLQLGAVETAKGDHSLWAVASPQATAEPGDKGTGDRATPSVTAALVSASGDEIDVVARSMERAKRLVNRVSPPKPYTVRAYGGKLLAAFDTMEDADAYVRAQPDKNVAIYTDDAESEDQEVSFERVAEALENWKNEEGIEYHPEEAWALGEAFYHDIGAFNQEAPGLLAKIPKVLKEQKKLLRQNDTKWWEKTKDQLLVSGYTSPAPVYTRESENLVSTIPVDRFKLPDVFDPDANQTFPGDEYVRLADGSWEVSSPLAAPEIIANDDALAAYNTFLNPVATEDPDAAPLSHATRPRESKLRFVIRPTQYDIVWAAAHDVYSGTVMRETRREPISNAERYGQDEPLRRERYADWLSSHMWRWEPDEVAKFGEPSYENWLAADSGLTKASGYVEERVAPKAPAAANLHSIADSVAAAIKGRTRYNELGLRLRLGNFYIEGEVPAELATLNRLLKNAYELHQGSLSPLPEQATPSVQAVGVSPDGKDKTHEEVFVNAITQRAKNQGFDQLLAPVKLTGEFTSVEPGGLYREDDLAQACLIASETIAKRLAASGKDAVQVSFTDAFGVPHWAAAERTEAGYVLYDQPQQELYERAIGQFVRVVTNEIRPRKIPLTQAGLLENYGVRLLEVRLSAKATPSGMEPVQGASRIQLPAGTATSRAATMPKALDISKLPEFGSAQELVAWARDRGIDNPDLERFIALQEESKYEGLYGDETLRAERDRSFKYRASALLSDLPAEDTIPILNAVYGKPVPVATPSVQAAATPRKKPIYVRASTPRLVVNWMSTILARETMDQEHDASVEAKGIREAWAPYVDKLTAKPTYVEAHDYLEGLKGKRIHSRNDDRMLTTLDDWAFEHLPPGTTPRMLLQTELGGDTAPAYQQLDFTKLLFDASDRATPSVRPVIETFEGWHTPSQGGGAAFITQRLVQESSFAMGERNQAKRWYVGLVQEWGLDGIIRKFEEHTFDVDPEGKEGEYKQKGLKMWWSSLNAPKLSDNQRKAITLLHYAAFQGLEYTAVNADQHRRLKVGENFNVILGIPVEADLKTLETILPAPLAARLFKAVQDAKASVARPAPGDAAAERAYERAVARVLYTRGLARFQLRSTKKRDRNLDPERHLALEDWTPRNLALVVSATEVRKALREPGAEGELSAYAQLVEAGRDKSRLNLETIVNEAADQLDGMHRRLRSRVPWLMRRDSLFLKYREGYSVHYFGSGYMGPNEKQAQMELERLIDEAALRDEATFNAVMRHGKAEDMSDRPLDDVSDRMFNYLYDLKGIPYPGRAAAMAAIRDGELVPHGIAPGADYAAIATEIHSEVMQLLHDRRLANQALEARLDSIANPVELAKMLGEIRKRFKKRESTNRARQRKFDTFEDAFVLGGKRPLGLGAGEAVQRYATDVMLSARTRVVLNEAVYTEDADGNMLVVPDPDLNADSEADYELLAKDVWDAMASRLADNFKYTLDPRKSAKQNVKDIIDKHIKDNPRYKRVAAPFSSVPAFYGYRKPGGEENVLDALFAGGEVPGLLKKIYGKPWEDPYGILKFLEHANQWMKVQSLQFSLFFPIAAQESLLGLIGHKYFSKDGLPSQVELRRMIKARHPWVMSLFREADSLGLELGGVVSPLDVPTDIIASDIEFLHDFTAKNFGDATARGVKGLLSLSRKQTDFMFESYFNTVKLWAFLRFKHELQERALNEGREFDLQEEIGPYMDYLNSEIGGINWNKVSWMTPSWRRNLQLFMFSPNWSQSAINAAGFGALTGPVLKNYNTPEELKFIMRHRWPNMFLWVMLLAPAVVQAAAYTIGAALGGVDDDDEFLMFNNEEGRKLHADITPLMRTMPWYKGAPTGKRRTYIRWGKQAYETKRWLEAPWASLMGKSSQIARWAIEMATGESVGGYGWSLPFQDQGLIGWVRDKDGNFMGSRLGYTVQKFMPFSLLAWAQNPDAAPLQIIGPTSKGISFYNATQAYMGILDTWARSTTYDQLYRNPRIQSNLEALGFDILEAARRNGYEPKNVIKSAVGAVMKDLYANLYKAVDANDQKEIERWSRAIIRLNGTVNRALQSTRNRDKMYGTPAELSKEHEALVREAFENP